MRPFVLFWCLMALAGAVVTPAMALDVPAPSRVDAVTVFLSGAEVTRVAKVKILSIPRAKFSRGLKAKRQIQSASGSKTNLKPFKIRRR